MNCSRPWRTAVDRCGRVDVMVNNAGVMPLAFFADHAAAADAWDRCIDINIKGVRQRHRRRLRPDDPTGPRPRREHLLGVRQPRHPGSAVYSATKAAVVVLSESLRLEAQGKIKVTVVRPTGVLGTGLGGRRGQPATRVDRRGRRTSSTGSATVSDDAMTGGLTADELDVDDTRYWAITPDDLVAQIVYAIDQPWGITINDITVRATGEDYFI